MKNENVSVLSDADFKRAVGVQRDIFNVMLEAKKKNIVFKFCISYGITLT